MNTTSDYKMKWFVDKYNNKQLDYIIANTKKKFGTIVMPTGTGKSGKIYEDCIYNILHKNPNKKLIICICSHILNLNEQTFLSFFEVLKACNVLNSKRVALYLNSSSSLKNYENMSYNAVNNIFNIDNIVNFEKDNKYDIALVSSCNNSFSKFINKKINAKKIDIITYIDECHTLLENNKNLKYDIDLKKLIAKSYKLYALSATPSYFITIFNELINKSKKNKTYLALEEPIFNMSPEEAIRNHFIIKPYVKFIHTSDGRLNANRIINCLNDAIASNSCKNHKILVTCGSIAEVEELYKNCKALGTYCFKNTSDDDWKIKEFCDKVENYDGHCIIFHCRKLIQGIDIKSITDAIIYNNTNGDNENNTRIIQIIGRALRTADGEFGKEIKKKKFANIYIISKDEEYDKRISKIILKYYGINNILFNDLIDSGYGGFSPIKTYDGKNKTKKNPIQTFQDKIEELKLNFQEYLENYIIPNYQYIIDNGGIIPINQVLNNIDMTGLSDINTLELFDNTMKIDIIKETFKKYNINI